MHTAISELVWATDVVHCLKVRNALRWWLTSTSNCSACRRLASLQVKSGLFSHICDLHHTHSTPLELIHSLWSTFICRDHRGLVILLSNWWHRKNVSDGSFLGYQSLLMEWAVLCFFQTFGLWSSLELKGDGSSPQDLIQSLFLCSCGSSSWPSPGRP